MDVRIRRLDGPAATREIDRVWAAYDAVFGDWTDQERWGEELFLRHAARDGFRLLLAESGSALVGFAWGYRGEPGQFWSDWVIRELPAVGRDWIGGHDELVSVGVLPDYRGRGIAGQLVDAFLADSGPRALLSTELDPASSAVRLYRSRGFAPLGELSTDVQVMGRGTPRTQ
jgi:ribosomal protein S18 acetylase RimI-like enzyme